MEQFCVSSVVLDIWWRYWNLALRALHKMDWAALKLTGDNANTTGWMCDRIGCIGRPVGGDSTLFVAAPQGSGSLENNITRLRTLGSGYIHSWVLYTTLSTLRSQCLTTYADFVVIVALHFNWHTYIHHRCVLLLFNIIPCVYMTLCLVQCTDIKLLWPRSHVMLVWRRPVWAVMYHKASTLQKGLVLMWLSCHVAGCQNSSDHWWPDLFVLSGT